MTSEMTCVEQGAGRRPGVSGWVLVGLLLVGQGWGCTAEGTTESVGADERVLPPEGTVLDREVAALAPAWSGVEGVEGRGLPGYRVLGEFEGHFDTVAGTAHLEMLGQSDRKSAAVPGMDQSLRSHDGDDPVAGRVRFLQDASGNGQTVAACEQFWLDHWSEPDPDPRFWVPSAGQAPFLDDLRGDALETRFCTNFELINDVGRPLREVWIIVDGITIPDARAWVQGAPRFIASQEIPPEGDTALEPNSTQGMFRYGDFAEDESVTGQWYFYLAGAPLGDFRVRGQIVEIFRERCWTGSDDNGDGLADSGCGIFSPGADCSMNQDCLSGSCDGGVPIDPVASGSGQLGECLPSALAQPCFENADCAGALVCSGGNFGAQVFGTCAAAEVPVVQTNAPEDVLTTQATLRGTLLANGSNEVTSYGFCYGPDENPALGDPAPTQCSALGGTPGVGSSFDAVAAPLEPARTYHVRAYAENAEGVGYGAELVFETPPLAPTGVVASQGTSSEHVVVSWDAVSGATGYIVYRDGALVTTLGAVTSMEDTGADAPELPAAPTDVSATDGIFEVVELSWTAPTPGPGTTHSYTVSALYGGAESDLSAPADGFRGAYDVTGYEVRVNGGSWVATGSMATTWTDNDAPAGVINPGTVSASQGTSADFVALSLLGASTFSGAIRSYEVRAVSDGLQGASSTAINGNRAVGPLTTQWERSAGDSDSGYATLGGAFGLTHNDATAPADGSGRWYRAVLSADGAEAVTSPGARGYRLAGPASLNASQGASAELVSLSWTASAGATGYRVYRDGSLVATVGAVTSHEDFGADEGDAPAGIFDLSATTTLTDTVTLSWTAPSSPPGTTHTYTVTALSGAEESGASPPANGWRSPRPVTGYEVEINGGTWQATGSLLTTWNDDTAPAGTINPGTATASDATSASHVSLVLTGASTTQGAMRTYRVRAVNASGTAVASNNTEGRRGVGALSIQWQRSAGDSDGSYTNLFGATSATHNDTTAPATGAGRWYRAQLTAAGAVEQLSNADRGFRLAVPTGVTASQGTSVNLVTVSWDAVPGATGYQVMRDGGDTFTVGAVVSYNDTDADPGPAPPTPTGLTATAGLSDRVTVSWTAPTPQPGTTHGYQVRALNGPAQSGWSTTANGFRGANPVLDYDVLINGIPTVTVAAPTTSYNDMEAPPGTINPGATTVSQGTVLNHVELRTILAHTTSPGPNQEYRVRARNSSGHSDYSGMRLGRRAVGALSYQWQRTNVDSQLAGYFDLTGGATTNHNDATAPVNGAGRWYRLRLTAMGAAAVTTTPQRGYREPGCPALDTPANGAIAYSDQTRIGSVASYSCGTNHVIDDVAEARYLYDADLDTMIVQRECQPDNTWSGVAVDCTPACTGGDCPIGWCPDDTVWRRCAPNFQVGAVTFNTVYIPRGSYTMGSPLSPAEPGRAANEGPVEVTLTRPFYMLNTEVTQGQWEVVTGQNPACFQDPGMTNCNTFNSNSNGPVERVNWWSVLGYANALSNALGLESCYELPGTGCTGTWQAGNLDCGDGNMPGVNAPGGDIYACEGFRLPTEAEWEFAARAGTLTATYNGNIPNNNCMDNFSIYQPIAHISCFVPAMPLAVGGRDPNPWGLFDMLGNVWHWTWDRYVVNHPGGTDPAMEATGDMRTRRGASYLDDPQRVRAAYRFPNTPSTVQVNYGFRLVRTVH